MIDSLINKKKVVHALEILKKLTENYYDDFAKKKPLLEAETSGSVFLQVSVKKIPKTKLIKKIRVALPHSLVRDNTDVCLIAGDLDKRNHKAEIEPDILHYKELLDKHGVAQISEIVTLRQLRTEYKSYESRQKLLAAYDVFLNDNKITECLPRVLGKHFFKKRKFPVQINLKTKNLKQQIDKALSIKEFYFTGKGDSCSSEVAYLDMDDSEIVDNVLAMVKILSEQLPGHVENIKGIHLKTARSKSIPLYLSYENEVQVEDDIVQNHVEFDDLPTLPNRMVKVFSDGTVKQIRVRDDKIEVMKTKVKGEKPVEEEKEIQAELSIHDTCNDVDERNSSTELDKNAVLLAKPDEKKKQSKKAKRKSKAGLFGSSNDVTDKKDPAELNEFVTLLDEANNEKNQSKKTKRKSKVVLSGSNDDVTDKEELVEFNEEADRLHESNKVKKATRKSKVGLSDSNKDVTDKEDPVEFNEAADMLNESNKVKKQSKKAKRKSNVGLSDSNNDVTDKEDPVEFNEVADMLNESNKVKKAKRKSKVGLSDSNNDVTDKEDPVEFNEVADMLNESNKVKKAKRKSKVGLSDSNNDVADKEDPVEFNEVADMLNESNKVKKQSKKAKRKSNVGLSCSNNDVTDKEDPVQFNEGSEAHSIVELSNKKKKLKKNEKESKSLCDNSNSSETTMPQIKKAVRNENANGGNPSKRKHSAVKEVSLEETGNKSEKLRKRKRSESEFTNNEVNDGGNRTPIQMKKRAKLENVNRIQTIAMKEALQVGRRKREIHLRKAKHYLLLKTP